MKVLLINLTRFGDLLQSQATINDLVAQKRSVGLVCLENFYGAAELLDNLSYCIPFPGSKLLKLTNSSNIDGHSVAWQDALAQLFAWRDKLKKNFSFDNVCNLTPSLSARLLSRFLVENKPIHGFGVDSDGFGTTSNLWGAYLQGAAASRGVSPFNVVDLFRKSAASIEVL